MKERLEKSTWPAFVTSSTTTARRHHHVTTTVASKSCLIQISSKACRREESHLREELRSIVTSRKDLDTSSAMFPINGHKCVVCVVMVTGRKMAAWQCSHTCLPATGTNLTAVVAIVTGGVVRRVVMIRTFVVMAMVSTVVSRVTIMAVSIANRINAGTFMDQSEKRILLWPVTQMRNLPRIRECLAVRTEMLLGDPGRIRQIEVFYFDTKMLNDVHTGAGGP